MGEEQNLEKAFRSLETEFIRLRRLYFRGKLQQQEFIAELKKLRVRDEEGRFWTIGAQSGRWYYFDGRNWVRAEPPLSEEDWTEVSQPNLVRVEAARFLEKSLKEEREKILEARPFLFSPEIASLKSRLQDGVEVNNKDKWVLFSLPLLSTSLFLAGLGTILGLLFGAIVGSTRFFLNSLKFLPFFLQEIQGKLTGGIVFAGLGSLSGFILGALAGLILALIFNLTSSLTGGLLIKARMRKEKNKS